MSHLDKRPVAGVHPGLLSGLAFASANTAPEPGKDDGILTELEVAVLDPNRVDTVVLSACETGSGEVAGEKDCWDCNARSRSAEQRLCGEFVKSPRCGDGPIDAAVR